MSDSEISMDLGAVAARARADIEIMKRGGECNALQNMIDTLTLASYAESALAALEDYRAAIKAGERSAVAAQLLISNIRWL